jgi:hypothetical protein
MMEANASTLISFIYLALALLILWLAYVVVRVWLEARSEFLRQYEQQRCPRQSTRSDEQPAADGEPAARDHYLDREHEVS